MKKKPLISLRTKLYIAIAKAIVKYFIDEKFWIGELTSTEFKPLDEHYDTQAFVDLSEKATDAVMRIIRNKK